DVDDPGTPGCNHWEINVVMSGNLSLTGKKYELPLLDINYGIGDNIQLKYEVPNLSSQGQGETVSIVGSSKLGLKYLFFDSEEDAVEFALYPQFEFITPNSKAAERGLESPGNIISLPLLMSKRIGKVAAGDLMLTTNLEYNYSTKADTANSLVVLAGIGMPLTSKLSIMGELSTEQALSKNSEDVREQMVKANLGFIFKAFKQVSLFGSIGESLVSSDQINHTYFVSGVRL
ncbi:MAG: hypothetical protein H7333_03640, partial [Bdellovibrionales bacterium]|nr:hypothetical protein [Oligoflexia bacterium]